MTHFFVQSFRRTDWTAAAAARRPSHANWAIALAALVVAMLGASIAVSAETPKEKPAIAPTATDKFDAPYPHRTDPFRLPDNKAALAANRRDAVVQQINLKLKGFINIGDGTRAVVELDGHMTALSVGDKRGDIQVLEIAPPTLTLQRGRHRWSESLLENAAK